jgi:hypothetical protein
LIFESWVIRTLAGGLLQQRLIALMPVMSSPERAPATQVACAVLYRLREARPEFCLVASRGKKFELPQISIRPKEPITRAALRAARSKAGLDCKRADPMPLDQFSAIQNDRHTHFISVLVAAPRASEPLASARCRWCFAEEARARIRRKPMRRLIDLAVRRLDAEPKPKP